MGGLEIMRRGLKGHGMQPTQKIEFSRHNGGKIASNRSFPIQNTFWKHNCLFHFLLWNLKISFWLDWTIASQSFEKQTGEGDLKNNSPSEKNQHITGKGEEGVRWMNWLLLSPSPRERGRRRRGRGSQSICSKIQYASFFPPSLPLRSIIILTQLMLLFISRFMNPPTKEEKAEDTFFTNIRYNLVRGFHTKQETLRDCSQT